MDIVITPPKRTGRKLAMVAAGIAVLIVSIALARLDPAVPTVAKVGVIIDSVRRGDVLREVRGPGNLVPERIRWITAQASARVDRIEYLSGTAVREGQLILVLSNPDLQIQTMQADQQVRQAEIELLNLRTNLRSAILTQEGTVASARTQFVSAQQEAAAADSLVRRNLISGFELRNRRAQAEEMTTRLRVEQERLELMRAAIDSQIEVQRGQVVQLRAIAANQQARLNSLNVRAPDDGVVQEMDLELGQWVPEGTTLAKVVQPGRLKAELRIPESQAKDVSIGQLALVDTRNGIIRGRVSRKDPSAVGGSVRVDVALEGALPPGAVPDLSVDGTVQLERLSNILFTGRPAFGAASGTVSMFKLEPDGEHAVRVSVELGRSSVNTIEILRGLEPGDRVVLSDMTQYANVDRVRIK
jgi:multidrug efflux pump subunit AcrA (membrane-fusion protein)